MSVEAGSALSFRVSPTDPDGDVPGVFLANPPQGSDFPDNFDGTRTFRWTTTDGQIGSHRLLFVSEDARDRELTHSIEVFIEVLPRTQNVDPSNVRNPSEITSISVSGNQRPELTLPIEHTIRPGDELSFRVAPVDPDGDVPGVYMENAPSGAALPDNGDGSRTFIWRPSADQVGLFRLNFVVQDARDPDYKEIVTVSIHVIANGLDPSPTTNQPLTESTSQPNIQATVSTRVDQAAASRFLARSTFGPTEKDRQSLMSLGYEAWLELQMSLPVTSHLSLVDQNLARKSLLNVGLADNLFERQLVRSDSWWQIVVRADDQFRQRVAFALSEIFVVSDKMMGLENRIRGFAAYNDILLKHAFGNYRDLLLDVTLNPVMGDFLSMRRNEKPDPENNIQPDQNYARELMQLFTIGLNRLNLDGSIVRDATGNPIPAYSETDVSELSRVLTGWNYGDASELRTNNRTHNSEILPMKAFESYHDSGSKTLVGGVSLPEGQSARQDLEMALDILFNHPNVGPFTAKLLIQRLVTSNPSPDYIRRVASVFNNNGQGVRGDMAATVRAILLDTEALDGHRLYPDTFGKLKEPLIKIASVWRAFEATGEFGYFRYWDTYSDLSQESFSAPSVFNFFTPDYAPPGILSDAGLVAPEFQILNENTILLGLDRLFDYAFAVPLGSEEWSNQHRANLNLSSYKKLANQPEELVESFNVLLLANGMSGELRRIALDIANATPLDDDGSKRVQETLFIVLASPEFAVQQ